MLDQNQMKAWHKGTFGWTLRGKMCLISRLPFQFWFILWPRHIWMRLMEKLEWDEGIQTRFPAALWLTRYGWFLCNMRYLYWSWYLHMCADVSCLISGSPGGCHVPCVWQQLGWHLSYRVFYTYGTSGNPKQGLPHQPPWTFTVLIGKRSFIFILCPSEYDQWRRKHAKDLPLIWAERSWESRHGKITLQRALPAGCLELLSDSQY